MDEGVFDITVDDEVYIAVSTSLFLHLDDDGPLHTIFSTPPNLVGMRSISPGRRPKSFQMVLNALQILADAPDGTPLNEVLVMGEDVKEELRFYGVLSDIELESCLSAPQIFERLRQQSLEHVHLQGVVDEYHAMVDRTVDRYHSMRWLASCFILIFMQRSWMTNERLFVALERNDGMASLRNSLPYVEGDPELFAGSFNPFDEVMPTMDRVARHLFRVEYEGWLQTRPGNLHGGPR